MVCSLLRAVEGPSAEEGSVLLGVRRSHPADSLPWRSPVSASLGLSSPHLVSGEGDVQSIRILCPCFLEPMSTRTHRVK